MADRQLKPYIPAEKIIPEFTFQAVALGLLLSLVMCAANIYVGLKAGMTVSAAIPASVISMGILRGLLKRGTILENNIVHTIASSGESLAAGIIFTVPAIVLLGIWTDFNYLETTFIAMTGGVMGVVMMIPLRKAMIVDRKELKYPEGVACAEVLKAGDVGGSDMMGIFTALGIGGLFKVLGSVVGTFKDTVEYSFQAGRTAFYFGTDISPMLMAVGFIVGWEISLLVFMGGAISFLGAIPCLAWDMDFSSFESLTGALGSIWDTKIRFFGIGAMVIGGAYTIFKVAGTMVVAVKAAVQGITGAEETKNLPRTEQGITGKALGLLLVGCLVLCAFVFYMMTDSASTTVITTIAMFILSFFFVAVASYIVGLVGSSNSPVSGMAICTVMLTGGLLLILGYTGESGMLATLGVAGVVCCAACTSGDICQDLKIGHILGATPRRIQMGEVLGTIIPALIIAPTMTLLYNAYGLVNEIKEGVKPLAAPQAAMFEKLVNGLFGETSSIPWNLVLYGAAIGAVAITIDIIFLAPKNAKFRLHIMPLAVGMYLPWTVTFPIIIGGLTFLIVKSTAKKRGDSEDRIKKVIHKGLLFASGLVAGEAILSIIIAIPMAADVKMPLYSGWLDTGWPVELVSLAALMLITWLLAKKALSVR